MKSAFTVGFQAIFKSRRYSPLIEFVKGAPRPDRG